MFSKYFKDEKEQVDFFIAIAVIVLAGLLIGYYSFSSDESFIALESDNISNPKVESLEIDGKTFVALKTSSVKRIKKVKDNYSEFEHETLILSDSSVVEPAQKDAAIDHSEDEIDEDQNDVSDEQEISEDDFDEDFDDEDFDEEDFDGEDSRLEIDDESELDIVSETDDAETESDNSPIENEIDEVENSEATKELDVASISTDTNSETKPRGDCIIVIGAFGNKSNIKKLIGKLDYIGYPIFKVPFKGLTRVGVYDDCDSIHETLIKIQNTYSPDAFIMKAR